MVGFATGKSLSTFDNNWEYEQWLDKVDARPDPTIMYLDAISIFSAFNGTNLDDSRAIILNHFRDDLSAGIVAFKRSSLVTCIKDWRTQTQAILTQATGPFLEGEGFDPGRDEEYLPWDYDRDGDLDPPEEPDDD